MPFEFDFHVAGRVVTAEFSDEYADDRLKNWHSHRLHFPEATSDEDKRAAVLIDGIASALGHSDGMVFLQTTDGEWILPARAVSAVLLRRERGQERIGFTSRLTSPAPSAT